MALLLERLLIDEYRQVRGEVHSRVPRMVRQLRLAHQRASLHRGRRPEEPTNELLWYLFNEEMTNEQFLDCLEVCLLESFWAAADSIGNVAFYGSNYRRVFDEVLEDVKKHMLLNNMAYRLGPGLKFHVASSEVVEQTAMAPALLLLASSSFEVANEEFATALKHQRDGNGDEAVVFAVKALESTLKIIGKQRGWGLTGKEPGSKLLQRAFEQELVPPQLQSAFTSLRTLMENGTLPVRNASGHGKGATTQPVRMPSALVDYTLANAASAMVLLLRLHGAK